MVLDFVAEQGAEMDAWQMTGPNGSMFVIGYGGELRIPTLDFVAGEKNIIGFVDDAIMVRMALKAIAETGGEGAAAFRERFAEQYEGLDEALACFQEFLGKDLYGWLADKVQHLPRLSYKNKKLPTYIDDDEDAEELYEQGLTSQTDFEITEGLLRDKFKQDPGKLRAQVTGQLARTESGRLRIGGLEVAIRLAEQAEALPHLDRCAQQFEDFCVVTESIRRGIPVRVRVLDRDGLTVHEAGGAEEARAPAELA